MNHISGKWVFAKDFEEVVFACTPSSFLLWIVTVPNNPKYSPTNLKLAYHPFRGMEFGIVQVVLSSSLNNVIPDKTLFANRTVNSNHSRTVASHFRKILTKLGQGVNYIAAGIAFQVPHVSISHNKLMIFQGQTVRKPRD